MAELPKLPFSARFAGAVGAFAWLIVAFQLHLVNQEGWSPLLFLWLGVGGAAVFGLMGAAAGWVLARVARPLPPLAQGLIAAALPAGIVYLTLLRKTLGSGVLEVRADVLEPGTTLSFVLAGVGLGIALALGRRLRAPLPTAIAILVTYLALGLLSQESAPAMREKEEVAAELREGRFEPAAERLLVFGSDGLDWGVLEELFARGELPHFQALVGRSASAPYQTMEPTLSPIIWNTMATGLPWQEHRVRDFIYFALPGASEDCTLAGTFLQPVLNRLGRESGILLPYLRLTGSVHRQRLAFWETLDEVHENSVVVNWWATHPPPDSGGAIVSDQAVENLLRFAHKRDAAEDEAERQDLQSKLENWLDASVVPERQRELVAEEFTPERLQQHFAEARELLADVDFGLEEGLPHKQVERFARALIHGEIVRKLLVEGEVDVYVFYERLTDQISHLYWQFFRPDESIYGERGPTPEAIEGLKEMVPAAYRATDRILGRLLEAAGDDCHVLVVSDHGFSAIKPPNSYAWGESDRNPPRSGHHHHGEPGVFMLAGPQVCPEQELGEVSIQDFAPTVHWLRGVPYSETLPGRAITEALCEEWSREHPPQTIEGWEFPGWRNKREAVTADSDAINALGELGYTNL